MKAIDVEDVMEAMKSKIIDFDFDRIVINVSSPFTQLLPEVEVLEASIYLSSGAVLRGDFKVDLAGRKGWEGM